MELLVVLFVTLIVFGGKKIPELGKGLGEGILRNLGIGAERQRTANAGRAEEARRLVLE